MLSLYLRLAAYALAAAAIFGGGFYAGGLGPKKDLAQMQAQDWQGKAQAAAAALSATQAQLKTLQDTINHNAGVIQGLNDENTKIAADRDANVALAQRLLHAAASPHAPSGGGVSKAQGGSAAAGPSGAGGHDSAAVLLANTAAECQRNADRLDALIAEITPQL